MFYKKEMTTSKNKNLKGIHGWLGFYTACLLFFGGIFILSVISSLIPSILSLGFNGVIILVYCVTIGYSAYSLIKEKREAITWNILNLVIGFIFVLFSSSNLEQILGIFIGSFIWILYFLNSERVHNTLVKE